MVMIGGMPEAAALALLLLEIADLRQEERREEVTEVVSEAATPRWFQEAAVAATQSAETEEEIPTETGETEAATQNAEIVEDNRALNVEDQKVPKEMAIEVDTPIGVEPTHKGPLVMGETTHFIKRQRISISTRSIVHQFRATV